MVDHLAPEEIYLIEVSAPGTRSFSLVRPTKASADEIAKAYRASSDVAVTRYRRDP